MKTYLFAFILLLLSFSCENDKNFKTAPHVNAFPKKVSIYSLKTGWDSLIQTYQFYKNSSENYFDSIYANPGIDSYTNLYYDDSTSFYGIKDNSTFAFYNFGFWYNSLGNLEYLEFRPYGCDGLYASDEYYIFYNLDGAMSHYKRHPFSDRCGGWEDSARFSYFDDKAIVHSGQGYGVEPLMIDTVHYFTDNQHVSTIPLFYNFRNRASFPLAYSSMFFGYFFDGIVEFIPFQTKNMPLVKKITNKDGDAFFFNYTFNSNKDVSELLITAESAKLIYLADYSLLPLKYKFEY